MKKIRVGIVGFGIVGKRRMNCILEKGYAKVIAVCDKNLLDGFLENTKIKTFKDFNKILEEDIDSVIVCMPNNLAHIVTMAALRKGLHVFCEKPPGKTDSDIEKIHKYSLKNPKLKLMYGFNHRYHDSIIKALEILKKNKLGKLISLKGVYGKSKLITFNQPDWRTKRNVAGGGVLLDQGIHMVDLIRLFGGDFNVMSSFISNEHWKFDVEDNAYALLKNNDNVVAIIHSSATQWKHVFNLEINCQKGSLVLSGILSGTKSYGSETLKIIIADPNNDAGDPREEIIKYNQDNSWNRELKIFFDAIKNNKTISSGTSKDALETMRLVYNIYRADKAWQTKYNI